MKSAAIMGTAAFALLADQVSKAIAIATLHEQSLVEVTSFFNLTLSFNPGISFGLLRNWVARWPEAAAIAKLGIAALLIFWAMISRRRVEQIGFAATAGGALGNALDRWRQGAVTDFLDLHYNDLHWPTFNLADVAVVLGCFLVLGASLRPDRRAGPSFERQTNSN